MEIINKKLSEIKPYEKNPRKNDDAVEYVANSINEFGFKVPIVVDKDGTIINGHTRYKAAKKLKLKEVPVIVADDLTEEQVKEYRLADNKVSELANWDFNLLKGEMEDFGKEFNMEDFGFTDLELEMIIGKDEDEEEKPEPKKTNQCKKVNRTIITYSVNDVEFIKNLLGLGEEEEINKIYNISAIKERNNK